MNYDLTDWLNVFIMTSDKPQMKLQFMHEKEVGLPSNFSAVSACLHRRNWSCLNWTG